MALTRVLPVIDLRTALLNERVDGLETENRRLQRKLQRAETIITLQKKVAEILGIPLTPLDDDETD